MKPYFLIVLFICFQQIHISTRAQEADTSGYLPNLELEEVIIYANELDVPALIRFIKTDTSFYKAFKNMRFQTYHANNDIQIYDRKGQKIIASLESETKQIYRNGCRTMNVLEETVTGDFYTQKGDYKYYTAEMYASLFFTKGKVCNESNIVGKYADFGASRASGIEKRKAQLKQLIFNPGSRVDGIPFFGAKSSIFTDNMTDKYSYTITEDVRNGVECYKFEAKPLPLYAKSVVINQLTTWFRKSDFSIVSRTYNLSYSGLGYDFNVNMLVNLQEIRGKLLPTYIAYNGNWHVSTQGRERVKFRANFHY